jgi:predicted SnoaL-like aldol condensation-catalyzing enzyme
MKKSFLYAFHACWLTALISCSPQEPGAGTTTSEQTAPAVQPAPETAAAAVTPPMQPAVPVTANDDHEAMLHNDDPQLAANKRLCYDMWRTLVDGRDVEAARQYLDENYIQHNPIADTGYAGLVEYFSSLGPPQSIPDRIQRPLVAILAERDRVAMAWVDVRERPNAPGETYTTTIFNMYRIKDGKIVEHWDHGTLPEGETPRHYVPVTINPDHAASLAGADPQLAGNKRLVYDMWRTLFDGQQVEEAPKFLAKDYIQHNPMANTGLEGFLAFFRQFARPGPVPETMANFIDLVAEGDKVVLATAVRYLDSSGNPYSTTWFDMWRVENGLLAEHWDTARLDLPPRAPAE